MDVNIGKTITMSVDTDKLPKAAMDHVIYIGLRNILMDAHASATKDEHGDEYVTIARAMSEKKLAALMAGEVRVSGSREGDPVRAEALRLATDAIKALIRKSGKKLSDYDAKDIRAKAITIIDTKPEFMAKAKALVDERKSMDIGDVDL